VIINHIETSCKAMMPPTPAAPGNCAITPLCQAGRPLRAVPEHQR